MSFVDEIVVRNTVIPAEVKALTTDRWRPIPHGEILDVIMSTLGQVGLQVANKDNGNPNTRYTLTDEGAKLYATMVLTQAIDSATALMLGVVNSWNKTLSCRIGFGSHVFVCTNGCFFAEKVLGRKHTGTIMTDLPALVLEALNSSKTYVEEQGKFFTRLRDVQLTDAAANDFIVRAAVDHDCITGVEISSVVDEWRNPRYEDFRPRTAWSLHNAATEVQKRIANKNGVSFAERSVRLSSMFADEYAADLKLSATLKVTPEAIAA